MVTLVGTAVTFSGLVVTTSVTVTPAIALSYPVLVAVTPIVPVAFAVTEMVTVPFATVVPLVSTPHPESVTSAPSTAVPSLVTLNLTSVAVLLVTLVGTAVTVRAGNSSPVTVNKPSSRVAVITPSDEFFSSLMVSVKSLV